ncbi:MAG: ABC transporter permease [Eubacteriales bacterium]|nr:ABC transporter permease [Eubacteriales bacterium]
MTSIAIKGDYLEKGHMEATKSSTHNIDRKNAEKRNLSILRVSSILGFFLIWQSIGWLNEAMTWFNPVYLPTPLAILQAGIEMAADGTLWANIFISLQRIFAGVFIGTLLAFIVAILFVKFKKVKALINPIFNFIGPIPVIALLPAVVIWFGIGESSKLIIIAFSTFMVVLSYALDGMKNTDPLLIRSAMSLGANSYQVFTKVIIKSAMPNIFSGIKASLSGSFAAMVVAEMMGATSGLGYVIINAKAWFKMNNMFLAIVMIGLLYTLFYFIITMLEGYLFRWKGSVDNAIE